ncbi:peptidylprolyl isomerase [Undibacterium sp. TJN19]|uniref:peptidylprolyl isomerase n=1 Tax=Undibacterium sp. TJN19 TaxID=3413055 RepID=UPI003BF3A712
MTTDARALDGSLPDERDTIRQAHVYHILLDNEEKALQLLEAIRAVPASGRLLSFKAMARKNSLHQSAAGEGDLGLISSGTYDDYFERAVFSVPLNDVYGPVRSRAGWHLIYVTEVRSQPVADLCTEGLGKYKKSAADGAALTAALTLSRNFQRGEKAYSQISAVLGPAWGAHVQDNAGDVHYFKITPVAQLPGLLDAIDHTEFNFARYDTSEKVCARSKRSIFRIDCNAASMEEREFSVYELRGAAGRVIFASGKLRDGPRSRSRMGRIYQYMMDQACQPATAS